MLVLAVVWAVHAAAVVVGMVAAVVARAAFVSSGLANTLPYQLAVCAAIGVITALLVWLVGFGH